MASASSGTSRVTVVPVATAVTAPGGDGACVSAVQRGGLTTTVADAWETFSRTAWRRLLILYVKVFLVSMVGVLITAALLVPQIVVIAKKTERVN